MRTLLRNRLRHLTATVAIPVLALAFALVGLVGASPAVAATGDVTSSFDITIHENDTFDITFTMKVEGASPSLYCTKELLDLDDPGTDVDVSTQSDQCILSATNGDIESTSDDDDLSIKHEDGKYIFKASNFSDLKEANTSMAVTFPTKVTDSDSHATVDGNTATWSDIGSLTSINAESKDSSGLLGIWIIIGIVAAAVVGGGIVLIIVLTTRQKKQPVAPVGAYGQPQMPGQPGMPGQASPGYVQPGGQPAPGFGQPQTPAQPGMPQPGTPGQVSPGYVQPGQQPYNPNGEGQY